MKKSGMMAAVAMATAILLAPQTASAEVSELKVPLGAGGFGFLPLHVMKTNKLVEKHAKEEGIELTVDWSNIGGPAAMNEALLSGAASFISAGPPSFLTLWDKTRTNLQVKGVAAMSTMPMFLNTNDPEIKSLDDIKGDMKIGVTSVKVSIPSIIMQMYAREKYGDDQTFRFDPFTVSMAHPDSVIALVTGNGSIVAHYASQPFAQRELKEEGIHTIQNSDDVTGGPTTFTMISTTTKFHDENPKAYAAFVGALKEAQEMIANDREAALDVLIQSMGGKAVLDRDEMMSILTSDDTKYTTVPSNVMKYATFMHDIGSLKNAPETLGDLFFESDDVAGGN
ncbi:ABC transporter substrate-binding protein [Jiella pacifica]|uniref:ABC transporter substrate-binding protein n=1 Tax=Jiella pacifica TaxID=2696469 RepID=A0A6N9SVS9_9HYPH|nr:ABC transporter substrate-binding protein [Jiella pacifica]NDW03167.1 ABC transporter substrate-binding protein [Jiella pacifica]